MEKSYKLHFITDLVDHYEIVGSIVGVGGPVKDNFSCRSKPVLQLIVDTSIKYIELAFFDKHTFYFIF